MNEPGGASSFGHTLVQPFKRRHTDLSSYQLNGLPVVMSLIFVGCQPPSVQNTGAIQNPKTTSQGLPLELNMAAGDDMSDKADKSESPGTDTDTGQRKQPTVIGPQ